MKNQIQIYPKFSLFTGHFGQFGENETVTLKTDMATGCSSGMAKLARVMSRAGWASLAALAALLPGPVSASDDPVTNLIR